MIDSADVVVGLAWGDEAKGKITSHLASLSGSKDHKTYSFVARWAGGNNAGHTVYVGGKKYKTHLIPSGVFHGIKSVIGPACVLHPESFFKEIDYLQSNGFDTSLIKVSPRCHIVTDEFLQYDRRNLAEKLGTTSRGIAPTYAAKAARTGILARDVISPSFIWDEKLYGNVLCEGAQGVWLDLDSGNYPYVTSSTTLPYGACSLGFPQQRIDEVWGAAKLYDTRSGQDPFFPESLLSDEALSEIGMIGQEFGVTTGRRRKVNWLNLDLLIKSVIVTGTTRLIISKCDVIEEVGLFKLFHNKELISFSSMYNMKKYVYDEVMKEAGESSFGFLREITFSSSPEAI